MFYAYILKSEKTGKHYYGSTSDLEYRLKRHNNGEVRYTKAYVPWIMHYFEGYETRSEALKREKFFKSVSGYIFLKEKGII